MGHQLQDVIAAIAQSDGVLGQSKFFGDRLFEFKAIAIGVTPQILAGLEHGLPGLGAHAKGVFIGGQLDDLVLPKSKTTSDLANGPTTLIGRNGANVVWCALSEVVGHQTVSSDPAEGMAGAVSFSNKG